MNVVVADTQSWEQIAAKSMDEMDVVESYVKNAYLGFSVPYVKDGKDRSYMPDFIARVRAGGEIVNLVVEVTGMNQDKAEKKWFVEHRWLPAVNAAGRWGRWAFCELIENAKTFKNQLTAAIGSLDDDEDRAFWAKAQAASMTAVWNNADDEVWNDV